MEQYKTKKMHHNQTALNDLNTLQAIWEEIDRQIKQGNRHNEKTAQSGQSNDRYAFAKDVEQNKGPLQKSADIGSTEEED